MQVASPRMIGDSRSVSHHVASFSNYVDPAGYSDEDVQARTPYKCTDTEKVHMAEYRGKLTR